ncbi:MAG TPA: family 20 glycosylhydrolase [Polyangiaceae bacterium]|nr:family 20 glycosylhydrolase [Polyangiaceae bacterium]
MNKIIPAPLQVTPAAGQFRFRAGTRVEYAALLAPLVDRFCRDVARRTGLWLDPFIVGRDTLAARGPAIRVELLDAPELRALPTPLGVSPLGKVTADERYSLTIGTDRIVLRAIETAGLARGLTTLLQLLGTTERSPEDGITLGATRILDAPRFAWRALTVDLARSFFTLGEVKRIVDLVALYKLNVLHLHLTDDQGWRIQAGRPPKHRIPDGSFYTNGELRELVAYAAERFVTILPEFASPGHAGALLRLRPELATGRNRYNGSAWLDPELPATFKLIEAVLDEIAGVFPGPFIDIGADEPPGMPENLYVKCVGRARSFLRSLGKRTVGRQESIRAGTEPDHVIHYRVSANGKNDLEKALKNAVPVIVSPLGNAQFDVPYAEVSVDHAQEQRRSRVGLRSYSPQTVAQSFDWEPADALGPLAKPRGVAGVGAAIWGDTIHDFPDLTFMLLPRLAGVAHKAWSRPDANAWATHRSSLTAHCRLWEQDELTYFKSSIVDWPA